VVDHGSSDDTVKIARQQGVDVHVHKSGTIASLRNFGIKQASGKILIFIDADVFLTNTWTKHIGRTIEMLRTTPNTVTGSWYGIPEQPNWIERYWFKPLLNGKSTHINSGHLIITKDLFESLGGFSEHMETGEDYDFSMRAKAAGAHILDNPDLLVIHEGYPATIMGFMRREIWHGKGDYVSLRSILKSKVAVASLLFLMLHALLVFCLFFWLSWKIALVAISLIVMISSGASYTKYREEPVIGIVINSFLYYCYFWARGLSFFVVLTRPTIKKMNRPRKVQKL
jgi:glycosyltransferase involved in cell wall biosynthesis